MKFDRVLVTGGAGFIGSHLADAYVAAGSEVVVVDDLSKGSRSNVPEGAEFHELDIREDAFARLVATGRFDLISHHAAQMDVRRSVVDPAADADVNVIGSLRLLEAAARGGVRRVVFASTGGAVYGEPISSPQSEQHPTLPLSPYGCAKLAVEHYLDYYRTQRGMSTVALRYANVYGPRQRGDTEAGVVSIFVERMLAGEPITIFGSGEQTRDFVFIDDVVRANLAVGELGLDGALNVGTGVETSVNDLFSALEILTGYDQPPEIGPAREGEQMRSVLNGARLRRAARLPEPVPLRDGLAKTVEWFRERSSAN